MPKAAMAASRSPLLMPKKTTGALVSAMRARAFAFCGVSSRAKASKNMPNPASSEVTFFAQRPRA